MSDEDWNAGFVKCLGVRLAGDLINDVNERGEPIVGETLLILLNGHWEPIPFTLPMTRDPEAVWDRILDTADTVEEPKQFDGGQEYPLQDRSFVVLAARPPAARRPHRHAVAGPGGHGGGRPRRLPAPALDALETRRV